MASDNENNFTEFWLNNPGVIFDDICSFNPFTRGSLNYVLNSYSRLIIIVSLILLPVTNNINIQKVTDLATEMSHDPTTALSIYAKK